MTHAEVWECFASDSTDDFLDDLRHAAFGHCILQSYVAVGTTFLPEIWANPNTHSVRIVSTNSFTTIFQLEGRALLGHSYEHFLTTDTWTF